MRPARIVSGGQSGVDRAALEVAIELAIPHGGWCPKGRRSEDGPIEPKFQLRETSSTRYPERTERNVADSDATLIVADLPLKGGTKLTHRLASRYQRPCLVVGLNDPQAVQIAASWLSQHAPETLNVAGPRESSQPGIQAAAYAFLMALWNAST